MPTRKQKAGVTLGSGLAGAGTGATIGSIFGPIGTAIGAGLGALGAGTGGYLASGETDEARKKRLKMEALKAAQKKAASGNAAVNNPAAANQQNNWGNWWSGSPAGIQTFNRYTPEQQAALSKLLGQSIGSLSTDAIEAQARKDFSQKTVPSIAERFTNLGAQRSSAFPQLLGQAGADLESNLAALKEQRAQRLAEIGLRPQIDTLYSPGSTGFGQELTGSLLKGLLSGENISGGLRALRDAYANRGTGDGASAGVSPSVVSYPGATQNPYIAPTNYQSQMWTSNPSNLVKGTQIPGGVVPGIGNPPTINQIPTTGYGSMKALYGI